MPTPPDEALAVLAFWFDPAHVYNWFAADPAFDAVIRTRFTDTLQRAADGELKQWLETPQGW
jgi:uncharacterized protein (DUF924 family)